MTAYALPAWLRQAEDAANLCPERRRLLAIPSEEKNQVGWGWESGVPECRNPGPRSCSDPQVKRLTCHL